LESKEPKIFTGRNSPALKGFSVSGISGASERSFLDCLLSPANVPFDHHGLAVVFYPFNGA